MRDVSDEELARMSLKEIMIKIEKEEAKRKAQQNRVRELNGRVQ